MHVWYPLELCLNLTEETLSILEILIFILVGKTNTKTDTYFENVYVTTNIGIYIYIS